MGIHYFYGKYVKQQGRGINISKLPTGVEGIIFDLNGLLHKIAQQTFFYGDYGVDGKKSVANAKEARAAAEKRTWRESTDAYLENLTRELNYVLDELKPMQYLIIAVDGVAPVAKTTQQRQRRFRDLIPSSLRSSPPSPPSPPTNDFTSALLAPGTPFMRQIDEAIQLWLSRSARIPNALPPITIYSGWWEPGEGEHKAFQFLRELYKQKFVKQNRGAHVVYGMDSDLMMLCLLSPIRNMYLSREDLEENVNIDSLFGNIARDMRGGIPIDWKSGFAAQEEAALLKREFVVMAMLLGNDFVPRSPVVTGGLPPEMMIAYTALAATGHRLTRLNNFGEPELDLMGVLIYAIAFSRYEVPMLTEEAHSENRDRGTRAARVKRNEVLQTALEAGGGKVVSLGAFKPGWYEMLRRYRVKMLESGRVRFDRVKLEGVELIRTVVLDYLAGIEWTLRYYTLGGAGVNWMFRYGFIGAPLMSDVARFLQGLVVNQKIKSFNFLITHRNGPVSARGKSAIGPVHQLLAINSAAKIGAVLAGNPELVALLTEELAYLSPSPETIELYADGIHAEYQTIPILPEVNFDDLISFLEKYDLRRRENTVASYLDPLAKAEREMAQDEEGFVVDEKTGRRYQPKLFPRVTALVPRILTLGGSMREPVVMGAGVGRGGHRFQPGGVVTAVEIARPVKKIKVESFSVFANFSMVDVVAELKEAYPEEMVLSEATAAWFRGSSNGVIIVRGGDFFARENLAVFGGERSVSLDGVESVELESGKTFSEKRRFSKVGIVRELDGPAVLMVFGGSGDGIKSTAEKSGELLFISEIKEGDLFALVDFDGSLKWSLTGVPRSVIVAEGGSRKAVERADEVENSMKIGHKVDYPDFVDLSKWWKSYVREVRG